MRISCQYIHTHTHTHTHTPREAIQQPATALAVFLFEPLGHDSDHDVIRDQLACESCVREREVDEKQVDDHQSVRFFLPIGI